MDHSLKRGWNTLVAGAALACLFLGSAPAFANITYLVDQTVGVGGVTGSITTNGVLGTLLPANILSWSLELTGDGASLHLTDLNSIVYGAGSDVVATSSNITFDYSSGDQGYLVFQQPAGVGNGHFYWCNAAPAGGTCFAGISVVPLFVGDTTAVFALPRGVQVLATAPEPSTWVLMLLGFGALGLGAVRQAGKARLALAKA